MGLIDDYMLNTDGSSLASTTESSLYSGDRIGVISSQKVGQRKGRKKAAARSAEPRFSRFAVSVTIPRPEQHTGLTVAGISSSGGSSVKGNLRNKGGGDGGDDMGSRGNSHGLDATTPAHHMPASSSPSKAKSNKTSTAPSTGPAPASLIKSNLNPTAWGSSIRLDIVRTDDERKFGVVSPQQEMVTGVGEGRGSTSTSDPAAAELLMWYDDEQVWR